MLGYGYRVIKTLETEQTIAQIQSEKVAPQITFPTSDDTLVPGRTYTITWNTGNPGEALFLSNIAEQKVGYSVSILDREYNITAIDSFPYTVPLGLSNGKYTLQIAGLTSSPFTISSK